MLRQYKYTSKFFFPMELNFATAPPGAVGGGTGDSGGGAPAPPAGGGGTSTPPPPASPGAPGASGAAAPPPVSGIDQLRTQYETVKKEYEPWKALGVKPEEAKQFQGTYQAVVKEISGVAKTLGYSDEEIIEAIHTAGPIATLDFLRNEAEGGEKPGAAGAGDGGADDLEARIREEVNKGLQPIHRQENLRRTNAANDLFERTTRGLVSKHFEGMGLDIAKLPPDAVQFIMDATGEVLKYDQEGLKELKMNGKTASVQKAFNDVMDRLDRYYVARTGWETKGKPPVGGKSGAPGASAVKRPSLEDMIEDPGLINAKYKV